MAIRSGSSRWLSTAAVTAALAIGGCSAHSAPQPAPAPLRGDAATQLAGAAGSLDGATTFRLTEDTVVPPARGQSSATPGTPSPGASPGRSAVVKMSGVWDVGTGLARMDGTINSVRTTVLSAAGVEYVSLNPATAAAAGKKWLKADNADATFGDFVAPRLVAQLLRAFHEVRLVSTGHLAGSIDTAEADGRIADPNLVASLSGYPDVIGFELWTNPSGTVSKVLFTFTGPASVTTGSVLLDGFGTAPAQVTVPTIDEVVQAPAA